VRIFRPHPVRLARALIAASVIIAAGCGGGSNSTLPNSGNGQLCDSNAGSISIARPSIGFPANGNTIEIVSSSSTDDLHGNPGAFDLLLNNSIATSTLSILPDNNGPHPYTTDFYYQANLNGIPSGTYNVFLNAPNSACTPGFIGTVSI
jgi:hypothetical protein